MKHKILGLLAVAGLMLAPGANALTISQSQDSSGSSGSLSFDFFDQSLGVLTGIEISAHSATTKHFVLTVSCPMNACSRTRDNSLTASLGSFALGSIEIADSEARSRTLSCSAPAGGFSQCSDIITVFLLASDSATDQSTLDLFTGAGTFAIPFSSSSSESPPSFGGSATVTYTYAVAAVPEPGTLALLGLGLLGLGAMRRKAN